MLEKYSRLNAIDLKISELKQEIAELESEKTELLKEIIGEETKVLNQLPARTRNSLVRYGIDLDWKLKLFLDGDCSHINPHMAGFHEKQYASASDSLKRLMAFPNIGMGIALQTMQRLEELNFFS